MSIDPTHAPAADVVGREPICDGEFAGPAACTCGRWERHVDVTDEMVDRALDAHLEARLIRNTRSPRDAMRSALVAAFSTSPEEER